MMGDCLERMAEIATGSIDLVLTDPPYGTTACKWDAVIPLEPMWAAVRRVLKPNGAAVFTASQPFTSALVMSNAKQFKYSLVWEKGAATGHLNAKKQPLRAHEDVLVFCRSAAPYFPIKTEGHQRKTSTKRSHEGEVYGSQSFHAIRYDATDRYPRSVVKFSSDKQTCSLHPTQKPVALMEYLIRTYTNPDETVLDFTMGAGTTGVACANTGRNFIGIERDTDYFKIAQDRIKPLTGKAQLTIITEEYSALFEKEARK